MTQKLFDNDLVGMRKSKVTLKLNKSTYVGMSILDLRKSLTYEFHYDYINSKDQEILDFSNHSAKLKCYDVSKQISCW